MAARKLIYHLMVLSPVLLLGSIAVESRLGGERYDEDPVVPAEQERVSAYIELIRAGNQILGEGSRSTSEDVRELGRRWVLGCESGRLVPLPPAHIDDSSREGARGQIFDARNKVIDALQRLARAGIREGKFDQAADDCVLALRAGEAMKYSDLYTVGTSTFDQRAILTWLTELWPRLSTEARRSARQATEVVLESQQPLDKIIARGRQQFVEASRNRGLPRLSIEEVQQLASIEEMLDEDASPQLVIHELKNSLVAAHGAAMPMFLSTVKMGLQSQEQLRLRLVHFLEHAPL